MIWYGNLNLNCKRKSVSRLPLPASIASEGSLETKGKEGTGKFENFPAPSFFIFFSVPFPLRFLLVYLELDSQEFKRENEGLFCCLGISSVLFVKVALFCVYCVLRGVCFLVSLFLGVFCFFLGEMDFLIFYF